MNVGLLFFLAHRTSLCQKKLNRYLGFYGIEITNVEICAKLSAFNPTMSQMLSTLPLAVVVSTAVSRRPDCAVRLFDTLHIPLDAQGEPKGVLQLHGKDKTGYLIESLNQAILVLPDMPAEIGLMLPPACEKLQKKFSLTGEVPTEPVIPYEELIENSMNPK